MNEQQFIQGFNEGYLLQKHKPELVEKIQDALKDSQRERDQGLLAGIEEYQLEELDKYTDRHQNYSHENLPDASKEPEKDKDMDREV